MTPQKERESFEAAMRSGSFMFNNDELEFQDGRNCYKHYWMHLMWRAWQAALADDGQEVTLADAHPELAAAAEGLMSLSIHEPSGRAPPDADNGACVCRLQFSSWYKNICDSYSEPDGAACRNKIQNLGFCGHDKACHTTGDNGGERV